MPTSDRWTIVKVPFPYTDHPIRQHRPALVVAAGRLLETHGLLWVLMITSAENRRWPDDVPILDIDATGLPAPSVVRCAKIATIDAHHAEPLGKLGRSERRKVAARLKSFVAAVIG